MLNYPALKFWLDFSHLIITVLLGIYVWWTNREKVTNARFTEQEKRLTDLEKKSENPSNHCPGHGNLTGRCDSNRDTAAEHKNLLTALESELKHLPKTGDLEKIYDRINEIGDEFSAIKADVARVSGAMPGITHLTQMMNQFLLTQGGKQ